MVLRFIYHVKKNRLGAKLGFFIPAFVFDEGLHIWHFGNIVVNRFAKIGKNCTLHGNNCIGNNGKNNLCPKIGDNCDIGVGASIIGNVILGNNIVIGAAAVVNKSCEKNDICLLGCPAKERLIWY